MTDAYRIVRELHEAAVHAGTADTLAQFENIGTQSQYRLPYAVTARCIAPGAAVLDWGCGNGHFSFFLERLGATVTGYSFEPAPRCMAHSATFSHVRGSESDPRRIPFPDRSFDAVCSVGVLEHVWETGGEERVSLSEIARILRPGGVFLTFHLPNESGWVERAVRALGLNKYSHMRRYTAADIRALWTGAGLKIEKLGRYNALPRHDLGFLPSKVRHSSVFVRSYNAADDALARLAPPVCTNFFVVARKS
ncbi:MAG TPA: class I SAM-dependent methyltransferase [Gemmatimonadaceae bacterium]|nr:class I SAM-dependent methyltransferase [Gemmatimonadaceae bacterium]